MILSIIVILIVAGVAYFHYAQGLFPATYSALCAGAAALSAFAFFEPLGRVTGPFLGAFADATSLVVIFAGVYLVLRFVIDNLFQGNVRYPVALDKGGAAVMGLVAGFFAAAIVALAAQQLPFGSQVLLHDRYPTADAEVGAPRRLAGQYGLDLGNKNSSDMMDYNDYLTVERIGTDDPEAAPASLWVPVDEWFVSLGASLSDPEGSLSGPTDFDRVYPGGADAYADATFARRLGRQRGALNAALVTADRRDVSLADGGGLFLVSTGEGGQFPEGVPQFDAETRPERGDLPSSYTPPGDRALLVVRLLFDREAADEGGLVRFGPANARLVAGGRQYFPIGTIESGQLLGRARPDDYVLSTGGVDLAYEIDPATALDEGGRAMADDAYLEFKELARLPIGGDRVYGYLTADPRAQIERKRIVQEEIGRLLLGEDATYTKPDAFNELRAGLPAEAPDAAAAEAAFSEGRTPDQPAPPAAVDGEPSDEAPDADAEEEQGGGGIMDSIRGEAGRRNDLIEGDE